MWWKKVGFGAVELVVSAWRKKTIHPPWCQRVLERSGGWLDRPNGRRSSWG